MCVHTSRSLLCFVDEPVGARKWAIHWKSGYYMSILFRPTDKRGLSILLLSFLFSLYKKLWLPFNIVSENSYNTVNHAAWISRKQHAHKIFVKSTPALKTLWALQLNISGLRKLCETCFSSLRLRLEYADTVIDSGIEQTNQKWNQKIARNIQRMVPPPPKMYMDGCVCCQLKIARCKIKIRLEKKDNANTYQYEITSTWIFRWIFYIPISFLPWNGSGQSDMAKVGKMGIMPGGANNWLLHLWLLLCLADTGATTITAVFGSSDG